MTSVALRTAHQQVAPARGGTRWNAPAGRAARSAPSRRPKQLWSRWHESLFVQRVFRCIWGWKERCRVLDMESAVWYCAGKEAEWALCGSCNLWPGVRKSRNVSLCSFEMLWAIAVWDSRCTFWFSCLFLRHGKSQSLVWSGILLLQNINWVVTFLDV